MRAGSVLRERGRERAEAAVRPGGGAAGPGGGYAGRASGWPRTLGLLSGAAGPGAAGPDGSPCPGAGRRAAAGAASCPCVTDRREQVPAPAARGETQLARGAGAGGGSSPPLTQMPVGRVRADPAGVSGDGHSRRVPLTVGERFSR